MCTTSSTTYAASLKAAIAGNPSFKAICDFNAEHFPVGGYSIYYNKLFKGTAIPDSHELCNAYLACYGDKHYLKMYQSVESLFRNIDKSNLNLEIFDWGCGQALATGVLIDFLKERKINSSISCITLIDPSTPNIERAEIHIKSILNPSQKILKIVTRIRKCEEIINDDFDCSKTTIKIHLFSNILDMDINSKHISDLIKANCPGTNYFVCVSPYGFPKLEEFEGYFVRKVRICKNTNSFTGEIFQASSRKIIKDKIFRNELIFKTNL